MLKVPSDFPHPGSEALLGDRLVKIIRTEGDGRRLVTGIGRPQLCKTVELSELSDAAPPADPVRAWLAERVQTGTAAVFTPVLDLFDDFTTWAKLRGLFGDDLPTILNFGCQLYDIRKVKSVMRRGRIVGRPERSVPLALKPLADAA